MDIELDFSILKYTLLAAVLTGVALYFWSEY
ncbi:hypothetical protein VCSRO179_3402 [Vibrio cholerae]|nr:hypothetical protein VCSRO204_3491 [Vibrio cholerae]GIA25726.1 hypothetical protein VCSRO179_3402 [Vibrio cholerae]